MGVSLTNYCFQVYFLPPVACGFAQPIDRAGILNCPVLLYKRTDEVGNNC